MVQETGYDKLQGLATTLADDGMAHMDNEAWSWHWHTAR